jgi:D-aminoacyl-tRNA deacylase
MRVVIQRAKNASIEIAGEITGKIEHGLLILVGIETADDESDVEWLCRKIVQLRIFNDETGKMNKSLIEANGEILLASQFTLHASTKKGNRPSYIKAAKPETAIPLYEKMIATLYSLTGKEINTGKFGADMQITFTNDGPVTIIIDSKIRE